MLADVSQTRQLVEIVVQAAITYAGLSRNVAAAHCAARQHHQNHVVLLHFAKFFAKEKVRLSVKWCLLAEYHMLDVLQH